MAYARIDHARCRSDICEHATQCLLRYARLHVRDEFIGQIRLCLRSTS